jgi:hypothetical protein
MTAAWLLAYDVFMKQKDAAMDQYPGQVIGPTIYQITVGGLLHETWSAWLDGLLISLEPQVDQTVVTVAVPDQAALRGVLNRLWDSNLTLISVKRIREDQDA